MERNKRKIKFGIVISDSMDKTRIVQIVRTFRHLLYKKTLKRKSKYYVHDEKNESRLGDKVKIIETRPLSRMKRWRLMEITQKAL